MPECVGSQLPSLLRNEPHPFNVGDVGPSRNLFGLRERQHIEKRRPRFRRTFWKAPDRTYFSTILFSCIPEFRNFDRIFMTIQAAVVALRSLKGQRTPMRCRQIICFYIKARQCQAYSSSSISQFPVAESVPIMVRTLGHLRGSIENRSCPHRHP